MSEIVLFCLLGLGSGGLYALLGTGMVMIYRGSGVINFAAAGFALIGAFTVYQLNGLQGLPVVPSAVIAILLTGAIGVFVQLVVMRPLRTASPLARVIATLGVLTVFEQVIALKYGALPLLSLNPFPTGPVNFGHGISIGRESLYLFGFAVVVSLLLMLASSRTRMGHAMSAAAENGRAAAALGWSPGLMASISWGIGGALAGAAGVVFPAVSSGFISGSQITLLIMGALAAALASEFKSFPLALAGGVVIGVAQSLTAHYVSQPGVSDAVPFLFIIVLLAVRGRGLPIRGSFADRLPRVGSGTVRPLVVIPVIAVALVVAAIASAGWAAAITVAASFAIIALSFVILTGYAGQLSIAQLALAGVGAYAAGWLMQGQGVPFPLAIVFGILVAMVIGLLFGLPALQTRGVNLAVVTFGLGLAVFTILFSNADYTNRAQTPGALRFLGLDVDPIEHPGNYAMLTVALLALIAVAVANLRRGRVGRRMLAVRTNERAAAAIGIDVLRTKLYAFTLSAAVAAVGGIMLGFAQPNVSYSSLYTPDASINALLLSVIGGIGYVAGPIIGGAMTSGGLFDNLINEIFPTTSVVSEYLPLATGIGLLLTVIVHQNGLAESATASIGRRLDGVRLRRRHPEHTAADESADVRKPIAPVTPKALVVSGLTQRFGGLTALRDVTLTVRPGEVLGLLGPNGAGKTTLIDGVTGYNRVTAGSVRLGDEDITRWPPYRRARAGLSRSFQSLELFDDITVRENLLAASDRRDSLAYVIDLVVPGEQPLPEVVQAAAHELGLEAVLYRRPEELSYGQRRLVAIARAVAAKPSVLLLDEPAAGLDEEESVELGRLVRRLADDWGIGVLLIEHDVALVLETSDRVAVLDFGKKIAEGTPSEIRDNPAVRAAYLGQAHASQEERVSQEDEVSS